MTDIPLSNTSTTSTYLPSVAGLPLLLKKLLCKVARYYNGQYYGFSLDENNNLILNLIKSSGNTKEKNVKLLIVARAFYQEQAKNYPIENKRELKKLLVLEFGDDSQCYYHIWNEKIENNDSKNKVNIWTFNTDIPTALITLPEGLLFALSVPNDQNIEVQNSKIKNSEVKNNNTLYIGRIGKVIHSSLATSIINSSQRFSMSVGLMSSASLCRISTNNIAGQLALGIKKLPFSVIRSFIKAPKIENRFQLLINIALPFFIVLSLYLALSSTYLAAKQYNLQQQLGSQSAEVSLALSQQTKVDQQKQQYLALETFLSPKQVKSPVWLVLVDLLPKVKLTNIRLVNDRFVLRGNTEQATNILELLSEHVLVSDAKFDFPIRKNRNRDTFVISFVLLPLTNRLLVNDTGRKSNISLLTIPIKNERLNTDEKE